MRVLFPLSSFPASGGGLGDAVLVEGAASRNLERRAVSKVCDATREVRGPGVDIRPAAFHLPLNCEL
jgi:hypothetical protein